MENRILGWEQQINRYKMRIRNGEMEEIEAITDMEKKKNMVRELYKKDGNFGTNGTLNGNKRDNRWRKTKNNTSTNAYSR